MQKNITYKEQFNYGLNLLKKDLEDIRDSSKYKEIIPYFDYPISILEESINDAIIKGIDTEEFYKEQCDNIEKLYQRLVATIYLVQKNSMTVIDRIKNIVTGRVR